MACSLTEAKEARIAKKITDGSKTKTLRGIANFIDANHSGGPQSKDCILILCEGLSAMSGIVSGLSSEDRNTIGIYPLKGKLLNVRGEQLKKIAENKEITDIKKILGLESGREYTTIQDVHQYLRYGKIMVMTDQDLDGSHIKGLCINLFHSEWASLVHIPGFISFMNTPILRAKKGPQTLVFYNDGEYETWKQTFGPEGPQGWVIKYFKGLGTSTSAEFKEYFANKKIVDFEYNGQTSDDSIDKIFNKKRSDDRKTWLEEYDKEAYLDTSHPSVKYEDFMNRELIHFSTYDCARSIPNMVDGLKISLRKILYAAFKRRLTSEVKVAQFSGYVSEHSAYHHGEASLNGAIVNMAQTFVGSNNINLLEPNGQFGTRLHGGDDSASERYIFTMLNPMTRTLFPEADDAVLSYLNDDGTIVEPEFYAPILPFVLLNGISGIGTGFSCSIPAYNPLDILAYLKNKINRVSTDSIEFVPYYQGFKGTIRKCGDQKYLVRGCYEKLGDDKVRITELPVGTWTMPYITMLEGLMDGGVDKAGKKIAPSIKDFTSLCTEVAVDIVVQFPRGKLSELESVIESTGINGVEKLLKLTTTVSTTNMHLFNSHCKLHKYTTVEEIIDDFYGVRIDIYGKRKANLVKEMQRKLVKLSNRARYIVETLDGVVDLRRKTAVQVVELMTSRGFDTLDGDFKYLVKMPMDSVTQENVEQILKEKAQCEKELEMLLATTLEKMWYDELDAFETEYVKYKAKREKIQSGGAGPQVKKIIKKPIVAKSTK
jgi:DNA topoisomerase-2